MSLDDGVRKRPHKSNSHLEPDADPLMERLHSQMRSGSGTIRTPVTVNTQRLVGGSRDKVTQARAERGGSKRLRGAN